MCAWWTGQPVYGSSPASKFVRENFAWLKTLVDAHEVSLTGITADAAEINTLDGSGITNADLVKLHAILRTANEMNIVGSLKSARLVWTATSAIAANLSLQSIYNGDIVAPTAISSGFSDANFTISGGGTPGSVITISDAAIAGTLRAVYMGIARGSQSDLISLDSLVAQVGNTIVITTGNNTSGPNMFSTIWGLTYKRIIWEILYSAY